MSQQKVCTCGAGDYNSQLPQNGGVSFQPTSGQNRRSAKPPTDPAKEEVYLFIRARRNDHLQVMKNFMVLESKIVSLYNGTIIGLADQVNVVEAPTGGSSWVNPSDGNPRYCMFVIRFDCIKNARLWMISDRVFKQQDCLPPNEGIEGFIVPLKHLPPDDCHTFMMMSTSNVRDPQSFQEEYIDQVVPLLNGSRVEQGVVSTDDVEPLRRSWAKKGDFIFIHQARSTADLGAVFHSDEYARIRECRDNWADCETLVFTVIPRKLPQNQRRL